MSTSITLSPSPSLSRPSISASYQPRSGILSHQISSGPARGDSELTLSKLFKTRLTTGGRRSLVAICLACPHPQFPLPSSLSMHVLVASQSLGTWSDARYRVARARTLVSSPTLSIKHEVGRDAGREGIRMGANRINCKQQERCCG